MMSPEAILYLCNFDEQANHADDEVIQNLWSNKWSIADTELCKRLLSTTLETDTLVSELKTIQNEGGTIEKALQMSVCAFLTFCEHNWNPHPEKLDLQEYLGTEWPKEIDVNARLQTDSEPLYTNILFPELLYFSSQIFGALYAVEQSLADTPDCDMCGVMEDVHHLLTECVRFQRERQLLEVAYGLNCYDVCRFHKILTEPSSEAAKGLFKALHLWWYFRSKVVHQRALEDTSASLYSELELLMAKLSNELAGLKDHPRLQILLSCEIAQAYLIYGRVQGTEEYLTRARELAGLKLELTGILGKRTKFQQNCLPQLALSSELENSISRPSAEESHGFSELPPEIELDDDVRLNKIQYNEKISQAMLPSLEQILCLLTVQYLLKSQARDELMGEELQPYLEAVLVQKKGAWATRVAALLIRCKLEANHKRTVERAMLQCETIVNDKTGARGTTRLSYMWATGLQPAWTWRQQLADLYVSLGLMKAALEEYQKLQLWEDVIVCYTVLQLRHKAAEIIQQQIAVNPTVKLYCLLGDATDDVKCYEKAWEFSNYKSGRAQRHWGNFLFDHKKYEECIPHYEKSVEINSIQEGVWLRLGYAALVTQQWEASAAAYRRYTTLQPASFEAWNNLAKVYLNQGQRPRAYRALCEALKYNYDNWKLWENVIMVSMDTGHFEDVLRGCHRLLDLLHKYEDAELLAALVRAVLHDVRDADGNGAARLQRRVLELFGRVTAAHQNRPEIWQLYADISPTHLLRAQRLLKAYRGYTQSGNWPNNPDSCKKVIELAQSLLECSLKARQDCEDKDVLQANSQLSSARLTGQAVLRAAEKQDWPDTKESLEQLTQLFGSVTEYMKTTM